MTRPDAQRHLANVLGALALDVVTETATVMRGATGLPLVEVTALSAVANLGDGSISVEALRREVDLSQSATVRLVDRLVERGLIRRTTSSVDGRVTTLALSAKGRRAVTALRHARMAALELRLAQLRPQERAALGPLLDRLVAQGVEPGAAGGPTADYRCRLCDAVACGHPDGCPVTRAVRANQV